MLAQFSANGLLKVLFMYNFFKVWKFSPGFIFAHLRQTSKIRYLLTRNFKLAHHLGSSSILHIFPYIDVDHKKRSFINQYRHFYQQQHYGLLQGLSTILGSNVKKIGWAILFYLFWLLFSISLGIFFPLSILMFCLRVAVKSERKEDSYEKTVNWDTQLESCHNNCKIQ